MCDMPSKLLRKALLRVMILLRHAMTVQARLLQDAFLRELGEDLTLYNQY